MESSTLIWLLVIPLIASLAAISVERVEYAEAAQRNQSQPVARRLSRAFSSLLSGEILAAVNSIATLQKVIESAQSESVLPKEWASAELRNKLGELGSTLARIRHAAQSSNMSG